MSSVQSKISTFFHLKSPSEASIFDDLLEEKSLQSSNCTSYNQNNKDSITDHVDGKLVSEKSQTHPRVGMSMKRDMLNYGRALNRKRTFVQLHLELGQKDFLLRTCSICGFNYAPGDDGDEKVHATFHKSYTKGIRFKGWNNERIVHSLQESRIIIVLGDDAHPQRKKVQEVVKMMETELGGGWVLHKQYKTYLFILSQRIVGCLIAEPIRAAYNICSDSTEVYSKNPDPEKARHAKLQFGSIIFHRETMKKTDSDKQDFTHGNLCGAVFCENEAVPAVCGIRAIWVFPSNRRKGIATHLLDATRRSFCNDSELQRSDLAFSQPTAAGRVLATRYTGTDTFLVYKEADESNQELCRK